MGSRSRQERHRLLAAPLFWRRRLRRRPRPRRPPHSRERPTATAGRAATPGEADFDDDDMENSLSLAAIEAELKPKVVETFDNIASEYKRLRRLQDQDIALRLKSGALTPSQERKYKKLKDQIIAEVKS